MKDYSQIISKITSSPWMITEDALRFILNLTEAHISGQISHEEIRARMQEVDKRPGGRVARTGQLGILSLSGPIFPKANLMTELSGATSLEQFRSEFRQLMADDGIGAVLLDVDSPGGLSDHVQEMAEEIRESRNIKPIYAIANTNMNSAAYYLGAQATRLYVTPSGQVGSIGTYTVHVDNTEQLEKAGIHKTVIKAGRFKAIGEEPLSSEARDKIQSHVNETNDEFIRNVAAGRGVSEQFVRENFGEGFVVTAKKAVQNKMADGVKTIDQVVDIINAETGGGLAVAASAVAHALQQNASNIVLNFSDGTVTYSDNTMGTVWRQSYDADKEHSEPGTGQGGEPTPREPPETGDKAIERGWRRDSPPAAYEIEVEEFTVNRTWLEERATALGVQFSEDTSDEQLSQLVSERIDEVVLPLQGAAQEAERRQMFAEQYPEEAKRLARLETRDRQNEAQQFADSYRVFADDSKRGFSTLVRESIADAHLKLSDRILTHEDLKGLIDVMASDKSIVPLTELGSSVEGEQTDVTPAKNRIDVRKQYTDLVKSAMTEDGLDRKAAMDAVAKQYPEIAKAYIES